MLQVDAGPHSGAVVLVRRPLAYLPVMRLPNAPPGLLDHPVPELRGTPGLYTNRHAVSYFTALLCGIPLPVQLVTTGIAPFTFGRS